MSAIDKSDFTLCGGLLCANNYIVPIEGCCFDSLSVCLCCAGDNSCLSKAEGNIGFCTLLPGCVVYPAFVCCKTPNDAGFEGAAQMDERKANAIMCNGCCLGPICQQSCFCIKPYTCCHSEFRRCLCLGSDCAFPCVDTIPVTCTCLPCCALYPKFGCCAKVGDLTTKQVA